MKGREEEGGVGGERSGTLRRSLARMLKIVEYPVHDSMFSSRVTSAAANCLTAAMLPDWPRRQQLKASISRQYAAISGDGVGCAQVWMHARARSTADATEGTRVR